LSKKIRTLAFFDSGQGGLTIWSHVCQNFPGLRTIYLGDNARYPFGTKSAGTVKRYTTEAILTLSDSGADAIVVACGTASSVAVPAIESLFALPIIGIVEGMAKQALAAYEAVTTVEALAAAASPGASIVTLATPYTVKSARFEQSMRKLAQQKQAARAIPEAKHHAIACPLLVALVEEGFHDSAIAQQAVDHYLIDLPADTRVILMGCTHFPRLSAAIARSVERITGRPTAIFDPAATPHPDAVLLIDPARSVSQTLTTVFDMDHLLPAKGDNSAVVSEQHAVYCTDDPEGFERTARYFCGNLLPKVQKKVISL
jgi:glutamate racemase